MEESNSIVNTSVINRHFIAWIIVLFALTGLGVLFLILTDVDQSKNFSPAIILIAYAPSFAALCVVGFFSGADGIRSLLQSIGQWRVGIQWYALVLFGPLVLVLLTNVIYLVLGGKLPQQWVTFSVPGSAIGPLIAGSFGEEIGWRGFAQPLLQKRYSILWASAIIGVLWATWHLWPAITPGGLASTTFPDVVQTYVRLISTAVIYGWIYNKTRSSLLLVMLAHAGHNIAVDLLPLPTQDAALILACLYLAVAIAVVCFDRRCMTDW
ncbi:MAG TPA: type II CAAX endopeptidase family protein [Ktedonobacteraceae bacterium]|jgi:membrane protease YdiL (CAAX protease family)